MPDHIVRCENCSHEIVEISLIVDGQDLTMRSCSTCDVRSWHHGGDRVELSGVLADISSSDTRYRRNLTSRT